MIRRINYITESAEHSFKHGLENFLTENLYYTTVESSQFNENYESGFTFF